MSFWNIITGGVTSLVGQYFENKKEEKTQKHQRKLETIKHTNTWETTVAGGMASSLKDEWWTLWLSLPLIAIFLSPFLDLFMVEGGYQAGMLMNAALLGLQGLEATPTWYTYLVGISVSASFGIRGIGTVINSLRK